MHKNGYQGAIKGWKNDLIISRARRTGLSGDQLLDAQQEVVLHAAAFEYDADRANGASEATALTAVIDHRLAKFRQTASRYEARQKRARRLYVRHENERSDLDQRLLAVDVRDAVSCLTPEEQRVCVLLSEGESIASIAESLQCHWRVVHRIIQTVREKFSELGLDGWVSDR